MVDVSGHLAMALLFAAPAWLLWHRREALAFVGLALATAMLPDADLYLRRVLPVHHHGVTHTVVFVVAASVVGGVVAARLLTDRLNDSRVIEPGTVATPVVFAFAAGGLFTGGLSHVVADVLSAPDKASALEPLWPLYPQPLGIDVIYYDAPLWNFGLFAVAVAVHVGLSRLERYPLDTRYRVDSADQQ
ncbi:metal-dependent hydrolase [Halorarius halobius]|uniref:metal-dependent hydrolase n=1 Tax=Halorarius halobius TaxID=2962671 RepID=UPI0020CE06F6|nr:metal-dependent hydrolase [Halorarius halobius]